MKIALAKNYKNQYLIVDVEDENAPMMKFYNEFSNEEFTQKIFDFVCNLK